MTPKPIPPPLLPRIYHQQRRSQRAAIGAQVVPIPPPAGNVCPVRFDIVEICQEASERAGREFRSGYDLVTARRSLELLGLEWANRGLNLWTMDKLETALLKDTPTYTLPCDTIDVLDVTVRNWPGYSGTLIGSARWSDAPLERIPLGAWPGITNKAEPGRPMSMVVNRIDPPELTLLPIPNLNGALLEIYRLRYMHPLSREADGTLDLPVRLIPAMIAGLAYKLAAKSKGMAYQRVPALKLEYEDEFNRAAEEDRDRSHAHFVPWIES